MKTKTRASVTHVAMLLFILLSGQQARGAAQTSGPLNVLFIAVDDLRPQLGCYGDPIARTPHMDAVAARGTLFNRAYCQQAVCAPSRASLLTGRRPDSTGVHDLRTHIRLALPDVITLPQHFRQNGYYARSIGKIYHGGLDDPQSWSRPPYEETDGQKVERDIAEKVASAPKEETTTSESKTAKGRKKGKGRAASETTITLRKPPKVDAPRGPSWEARDVDDEQLRDGQIASGAIDMLRQAKRKPFFLAVGFVKPHLPFVAPRKYYNLYPFDQIKLSPYPERTKNAPELAFTTFGELRSYSDIPKSGPLTDEKARELVRGYYAATSYVDSQIGRVLSELDRLGLRDKTIVVLWGDHGWHLGDLGQWCKHTNFDVATRAALMLSKPGQKASGSKTDALVEFVDIYPTLCEAAGLPLPPGLEGHSFAPLLDDPAQPWKKAAFSQYPRKDVMGYTMKTDRYRYTEWLKKGTTETVAAELYDHSADPGETDNISGKPEAADTVAKLHKELHSGWKEALPPKQP